MLIKTLQFREYSINVNRVSTTLELQDLFTVLSETFKKEPWEIPDKSEFFKESQDFLTSDQYGMLIVFYINAKPMGYRYIMYDQSIKIAYVPWGGIIEEFQGQGLYPFLTNQTEDILASKGIDVIINECEVPSKVKDSKFAEIRLKMFTSKLGYKFIDTSKLTYLRNDPYGDIHKAWDWYNMGFKLINPNTKVINIVNNKISNADYKKLYLALRYFELEQREEHHIRKQSMVFDNFLNNLEKSEEYFNLNA